MSHCSPLPVAYRDTLANIARYAEKYHRRHEDIRLVAVSKRHSVDKIRALSALGQRDFGENYAQEAMPKIAALQPSESEQNRLIWHFIGHIQSRKCHHIAHHFDWVHTIASPKVATRLNQYRDPDKPLNALIQLNLQQESGKSGIPRAEVADLAQAVVDLPALRLRGLMLIPRRQTAFQAQREVFHECAGILASLRPLGGAIDQLSMGMSEDMEAAIAEGATLIRIGTAIFGPRPD